MLPPNAKLLWLYLLDVCDCAGIVEVDDRDQISFFLGCTITEKDFDHLSKQVRKIDSKRLLILDFIEFQHGKLHDNHKMHSNIVSRLAKFDLKYPIDTLSGVLDRVKGEGEGEGEGNSSLIIPDMSGHIDTSIDVVAHVDISKDMFDVARKAYPGTKRGCDTEYTAFRKHKDWREAISLLTPAIEREAAHKAALLARRADNPKQFVPEWAHFSTWINQRRWEQDLGPLPKTDHELMRERMLLKGIDIDT